MSNLVLYLGIAAFVLLAFSYWSWMQMSTDIDMRNLEFKFSFPFNSVKILREHKARFPWSRLRLQAISTVLLAALCIALAATLNHWHGNP